MRIATISEFLELDEPYDPEGQRESFRNQFPYVAVVEGDFPEFDVAVRWCWNSFGPQHGVCWSHTEYPACPIVLATEYIKELESHGKIFKIKAYDPVDRHEHTGRWAIFWLDKTEYDHGFAEFYFTEEHQHDSFSLNVPSIDWGENYPWLKD